MQKAVLELSCLGPRKDVSIVFTWANCSMTCWSTDEGSDTTIVLAVLAKYSWGVVSEQILVSVLSESVDPHDMFRAEAALTLTPLCGDLNLEVLLRSFLFMWPFKNWNLSGTWFCLSVISLRALPDLDWVNFP